MSKSEEARQYAIHGKVKEYMQEHGLKQGETADLLGVSKQAFNWFLNKGKTNIGLQIVDAMAQIEEDDWS